ncbi:MAG: exodeoxyribonuclease III [Nevskia sp.]|nr:exodeoxyribonuclease III [Nevskia sp.]
MRIITLNANGIRSAAKKGLFEWLPQQKADFLCLQEIKAQLSDLEGDETFAPKGWHAHFNHAQKKGYAGVGVFSRKQPDQVLDKLGEKEFDDEGRYLELRHGNLSVVSLYLPSGSAGPERQASKDRFLEFFLPRLREWKASGRDYVICGDWNIAATRRIPASCRTSAPGSTPCSTTSAGSTATGPCTRTPKARPTPGGATAAMPTPTTSAGASTITSSRRA